MKLLTHAVTLPSASVEWTLIPFGCVHEDDPGFNRDLWASCVEQIQRTPHCSAIGLGDYFTLARTTYQKYIRGYQADEDSQRDLDAMIRERAEKFYRTWLKPMAGKLMGLAEGNHGWTFLDGTTDTQFMCALAKVPYLEKGSVHRVKVQAGPHARNLKMLVHHGDWSGGAMTTGGDLNALESRAGGWDVDITIAGHTHRKHGWVVPVLTVTDQGPPQLIERDRVYVRAGCFMRGYTPNCVSYVERKMLKPTALGWVTLKVRLVRPYEKNRYERAVLIGSRDKPRGDLRGNASGPARFRYTIIQ